MVLASEMNGPTIINSISFQYAYSSAMTSKTNVKIYIGHTPSSTMSECVPTATHQLVYTGYLNCSTVWNEF